MPTPGNSRRRLDSTHEYLTVPHWAISAQAVTYILASVSQSRRDLDRRIARLAVPALGAILAEPLYNLADTAIVGHLGRAPLDALAIATSALSIVAWLAIFLSTATTTEVSRSAARGEHDAAGRAVGAAYSVAAGWGAVTSIVVILIAPVLVDLLGGHSGTGSAATVYIRISALGLPFLYLSYAGNGHLIGLENTKTPLFIAVGANVANVALEIALVFGLHAGLAGSAWGTVTAQVLAAAAYGYASRRSPYPPARPARGDLTGVLRDGHRLSARTVALGVVPLAATAVTARLGPVPLAGQQIAYRLWAMLSLATDALAVPAQVFVSGALGRGDWPAAKRAAHARARPRLRVRAWPGDRGARAVRARGVHGGPDGTARRGCRPAVVRPHAAARRARVRLRRRHPRPRRLHRHAPGDAPGDPRLRAPRRPGAPLPLARAARRVDRARLLACRQGRAALAALG
jgi:putative MATE family efflux protein